MGRASSIGIAPRASLRRSSPPTSSITSAVMPPLSSSPDGGDVRMIQRGQRLRFARESRQALPIMRERLGQDSLIARRDPAYRARDRPVPCPFADLGCHFVDAEPGARVKRQRWRDYKAKGTVDRIGPAKRRSGFQSAALVSENTWRLLFTNLCRGCNKEGNPTTINGRCRWSWSVGTPGNHRPGFFLAAVVASTNSTASYASGATMSPMSA